MRQCVILVDRDSVRHAVARVPHDARRASRSAQRQISLDRHVHLKHDQFHALSVGLEVEGREQLVETLVPDSLHVIQNREDMVCSVLHQCQDTALALRLVQSSRAPGSAVCQVLI